MYRPDRFYLDVWWEHEGSAPDEASLKARPIAEMLIDGWRFQRASIRTASQLSGRNVDIISIPMDAREIRYVADAKQAEFRLLDVEFTLTKDDKKLADIVWSQWTNERSGEEKTTRDGDGKVTHTFTNYRQ
jgi:hypothetical protein